MKVLYTMYIFLLSFLYSLSSPAQNTPPEIYVDKSGVMRWTNTNNEASFYGVNYTLPFAHAYRAMNYLEIDHKEAIDRDVYHFARLGFNAYRIHIWDVEIADAKGELLKNAHLDLLDYLIAKLKEREIRVLITTMTNFGNGYPEKNQNTGSFSYLYDKCTIHSTQQAIEAQENYISQLIKHVNPYTQQSYRDDPYIIGFEINNEPCHSDTPQQTESYINRMIKAIKNTGNKKPIFYNVSHNMSHVEAYYNTSVQGTTYQWYPIGLVAGHTRRGNFLPSVANYDIPFANVKGFANKAKAIYEFDPADITYSYMYPAMTRTFRTQGFQWITQFAYDPIDMAWANTEYQTHYLNLAYTPNKAVSMAIAAQAAYTLPMNKKYEQYPNDTIFQDFRVSYTQDLSELNRPDKFYYSNSTATHPANITQLKKIMGCGSSPIVSYEGTGVYFLDQLEDGLWRLEVMPDAIELESPFNTPSLKKEVVTIAWNTWKMKIDLPNLGNNYIFEGINNGNNHKGKASNSSIAINPGVYLLKKSDYANTNNWTHTSPWENIHLGEFVATSSRANTFSVVHKPYHVVEKGNRLLIETQVVGPSMPDSVIIYTDRISFWSEHNPYIKMKRTHAYTYMAEIPESMIEEGVLKYNIVVCSTNKHFTFPANVEGHPLDWDFYRKEYWETTVVAKESKIDLVQITDEYSNIDTYCIPETSYMIRSKAEHSLNFKFAVKDAEAQFFWRKYIKELIKTRTNTLQNAKYICVKFTDVNQIDKLNIGFVTANGFTYIAPIEAIDREIIKIPLHDLRQNKTALLPAPYPTFLNRYFVPDTQLPFSIGEIEMLEISTLNKPSDSASIGIENIWLE